MLTTSVLIATYNGAHFLEQELESIRQQSLPPDEVLIADDHSSDGTCKLAQAFIDQHHLSHWRIIRRKKNLGFQQNFLSALKMVHGDLIFIADQDDVWLPDKVESMRRIFMQEPHAMLVSCQYRLIDAEGKLYHGRRIPYSSWKTRGLLTPITRKELLMCSFVRGCSSFLPRLLGHDWYLCLLASFCGQLYFLNQILMEYRIHSTNTSITAASFDPSHDRLDWLYDFQTVTQDTQRLCEQFGDLDGVLQTDCFSSFLAARISFFEQKNVFYGIRLLRWLPMYHLYCRSWWYTPQYWAADLVHFLCMKKNGELD